VVLAVLLSAAPLQAVGLVDPLLRFRLVRTPHFVIYFHEGEERLASRLAGLVEGVRDQVGARLMVVPPALTHVVVADQSELANGWATPLPRNIVFLNATVPSGAELIGNTEDWLRLVFTHEYTHIVHLDRSGGWAKLARGVFGRIPVAFPNFWLPQWQIEGLATFEESALTGAGRAQAGDFGAIARVGAAAGRALPLDRASGGLVQWPGGQAAYAAGLEFHEYLARRFGDETFAALATRTSRRLPFLGTPAFKSVYGESLGSLWRGYSSALSANAAGALTAPADSRRLTAHGYIVTGPRIAGAACPSCAPEVIYSWQGPYGFPSLRGVSVDGNGDRPLTTRYLGSTVGTSAARVIFDQQELRRDAGLYSDLYSLDRASGEVQALTRESRLQDPDLAPDGVHVVAVREAAGRRELVVLALSPRDDGQRSGSPDVRILLSDPDTQFSTPRWSPDGRCIVSERRRPGALPEVVIVNGTTGVIEQTIAMEGARVVTPTWGPGGRAIVAAADVDGGPFEVYEFPLDGDPIAQRLTWSAGATWPDVSADGRMFVFAGYTPDGTDVFTRPYAPVTAERVAFMRDAADTEVETRIEPLPAAATYSPLPTLAPTSWTPLVSASDDQTRVGAAVAGADLLGRHAYAVSATWLVSRIDTVRSPRSGSPDWTAAYVYSRWRLSPFASAARDTLFRTTTIEQGLSPATTVGVVRHEFQGGVLLPMTHVRQRARLLVSMVRSNDRYLLPAGDREVSLSSARAAGAFDSSKVFAYSISPERGIAAGATIELARRTLGSDANATTSTVDARAYLPGAGRNHVLAARAAAGLSRGEPLARQAFVGGQVSAAPVTDDFSSGALGLMRDGQPARSADRILVSNLEYRLPLATIERGLGTWPLLLRRVHAAIFADALQMRGSDGGDWRRAIGGEIGVTAVAGYVLPLDAVVGVAWGSNDSGRSGATIYARLGRAF
jgi:Tol biopolymer transport system component